MPISWKQHAEEILPKMVEAASHARIDGSYDAAYVGTYRAEDYLTPPGAWYVPPLAEPSPAMLLLLEALVQEAWEAGL